MNDKFKDIKKPNIDNKTGFEVGSQEYNEYYFPKTDGKNQKPNIDDKTGFEVGSQEYNEYYFPKTEGKQR